MSLPSQQRWCRDLRPRGNTIHLHLHLQLHLHLHGMELPTDTSCSCRSGKNIYFFLLSTRVVAFCHLLTCCGNSSSCEFLQKGLIVRWLCLLVHPASTERSTKVNTALGTLTGEQHVFGQLFLAIIPSSLHPLSTSFHHSREQEYGINHASHLQNKALVSSPSIFPQFIYFFPLHLPLKSLPSFHPYPRDLPSSLALLRASDQRTEGLCRALLIA